MKKMKKVLALGACAAMLVTASVMGTLAYLTSQETITNAFTVGKVSFGDETNDVKALDEAKVNEYGELLDKDGAVYNDPATQTLAKRVTGDENTPANTYKLIPDHTYIKDPTIHINKDSEECYLFVTVANEMWEIEAVSTKENTEIPEEERYSTILEQMDANGWKVLNEDNYPTVYVYSDNEGVKTVSGEDAEAGKTTVDIPVFGEFKVKKEATQTEFEGLVNTNKKIIINAYAVQAEGFTDAEDAWKKNFVTTP